MSEISKLLYNDTPYTIGLEHTIASAFSDSTAYAEGEYVYYGNNLYRFTSAHSAGAWNSAQVEVVTVMGEFYSLDSLIGTGEVDV